MLELGDIQGLVFSGYARVPYARYFLLNFGGVGAAEWLSRMLPRVTTSERSQRRAARPLNVAFTASGLRALGLPESALATFPAPFLRGMRAPEPWAFGGSPATRVDALVFSYAATPGELDDESSVLEDGFERFGIEAYSEDVYLPADRREHFGFLDARSNPRVRFGPGWWKNRKLERALPAGEFVLGYRNAYGHYAESPRGPRRRAARLLPRVVDALQAMDLGHNGSFVALQQLEQDVPAFWRFAERTGAALFADDPGDRARRVAEGLVGRTQDGALLGSACPVGAHVRRANPRGTLAGDPEASLALVRKHRLIRRGRLYGPKLERGAEPDGQARGLMFVALCADLERQFELVQAAWLDNPKFGGLTHERDPLVGTRTGGPDDTFSFPVAPFRATVPLERFVSLRGGAYLFLPGLRTLSYLAEGAA
jgi:deferrochelatase/peroxidase EfeB